MGLCAGRQGAPAELLPVLGGRQGALLELLSVCVGWQGAPAELLPVCRVVRCSVGAVVCVQDGKALLRSCCLCVGG